MKIIPTIVLVAAAAATAPALGQLSFEFNEATFDAGLSNPFEYGFDGFPDTSYSGAEAAAGVDFGFFTVTASDVSSISGDLNVTNQILNIFLDNNNAPSYTLTFDSPVTAFGADYGVPNGISGDTIVTVDGMTNSISQIGLVSTGFLGITSANPFTEITFGPGSFDNFSIDNLTFDLVPEPSSAAIFGLVGLASLRRRR